MWSHELMDSNDSPPTADLLPISILPSASFVPKALSFLFIIHVTLLLHKKIMREIKQDKCSIFFLSRAVYVSVQTFKHVYVN